MCNPQQQCINTDGSYTCMSRIICPAGFEPDDNGTRCVGTEQIYYYCYFKRSTTTTTIDNKSWLRKKAIYNEI